MPNRIIKESIWRSESLSKISLNAQGFFIRLLPVPDDHGCFDARPAILRGLMYPLILDKVRESHIKEWLDELTSIDSIRLWVAADGISYGIFPAWAKHQRIRSTHNRKTPKPPDFLLSEKHQQKQIDVSHDVTCRQLTASDGLNLNPNLNHLKTFRPNSDELRLSSLLFSLILERNPGHKKPKLQSWAKSFDLLLRVDKRELLEVENLLRWCQSDPFWQNNILSPDKFRKQYDQLRIKKNGNGTGPKEGDTRYHQRINEIFKDGKWIRDKWAITA